MIQYEDTSSDESVRIYDRGLDFAHAHEAPATFGEYQLTYRSGDIVVPRIEAAEPLSLELADFARAIRTGQEPRSNSRLGLEVVRALEAAHVSMERAGAPIRLEEGADMRYGDWDLDGIEIGHPPRIGAHATAHATAHAAARASGRIGAAGSANVGAPAALSEGVPAIVSD
jgi:hypothetical protein